MPVDEVPDVERAGGLVTRRDVEADTSGEKEAADSNSTELPPTDASDLGLDAGKKPHEGKHWCTTLPLCELYQFLRGLYSIFGGYVAMTVMQYGVNQGFGMSVGGMARRYYFVDVLHVDGATIGRYTTAAMIPWSMKPVVGLISDGFPLFGFHRTSYIAVAGLCGLVAYACLSLLPLAAVASVPFFFLMNISVSAPDVLIDGTTAELSKRNPEHASNLQSLSWGALSVGGIFACSASGWLVDNLGPQNLFLALCGCSLAILMPAVLRWLPEQRVERAHRRFDMSLLSKNRPITLLAALMTTVSVSLSVMNVLVDDANARGIVTVIAALAITVGVYLALRNITPLLAKTALFIFLRECLQPNLGDAMFVWLKDSPEGPQFSATIMGWMDCFGFVGLLLGITLYNKYLTRVSYRRIFLTAQVAMVLSNFFDFVLVKRWNLMVGIPDFIFIAGDDTLATIFSRFFAMPMLVLASKVCPDNIEATLFALLMALSNFGSAVSNYFGVTLCEVFGVVGDSFDHLPEVVIAKSLCRLLPIPLIFLLVPNLTPSDPIPAEAVGLEEDRPASPTCEQESACAQDIVL
eukprot:CAMPEP_0117508248 /NCGR_PEP_ID=MMETSP0784-20121206/26850_1 /TAXON_ID=39447 /ORGANISM="" /LENGTH=577 /DNA_ID=CAMNT_0005303795 /DNA_START=104 /DNA_END=1837 /DNA_ORIENTATION=+